MIKFFRKIRQSLLNEGKTTKYFKYAIGEIVLVVIGILIALQINNWNQNHKNGQIEQEYLDRLEEETKWNIEQLKYNTSQYLKSSNQLNSIIKSVKSKNTVSTAITLSRPNYIHPWIVKSSTYNELISTGNIKILSDIRLRELLDETNSFNYFSEQQLQNWRNLAIKHEPYFIPYKISIIKKDSNDKEYYYSTMNYEKMKNDAIIIELLKHWSTGNMVFYDGVNMLSQHYEKVLERIKCIKENKNCTDITKSIIKN